LLLFFAKRTSKTNKKNIFVRNVTKCFLICVILSACTSPDIYYNQRFNPPVYFGTHKVESGDTLYSIAWRYGRDFKELASANKIKSPYVLKVGQKIHLELTPEAYSKRALSENKSSRSSENVTKRKSESGSVNKSTNNKKFNNSKDINWGWPHVGLILAKYSAGSRGRNVNKGIDIGGNEGDAVKAAAAGEVVYAGNGLLGYGNLIIVNHNKSYLSAYGHNRTILVKEGQQVSKGQKIAEMGRAGSKAMLHFEIRKDGQPVNPQHYLPSR
jgi:lipoprotein NlpD